MNMTKDTDHANVVKREAVDRAIVHIARARVCIML